MAIAHRAGTSTAKSGYTNDASGTDLAINKPTGTVDNDIMVAVFYNERSATAWGLPSGWAWWGGATGRANYNGTSWTHTAWKKASSEGSDYTFTLTGGAAWRAITISSFSGAYTDGDPEDSTGPTGASDNTSDNVMLASITTSSANDMLIGGSGNIAGTTLTAGSSGMSLSVQIGGTGLVYVLQASAGASGTKTLNVIGKSVWATWHQAIKEASAGATPINATVADTIAATDEIAGQFNFRGSVGDQV
jgi:hypothetical protein